MRIYEGSPRQDFEEVFRSMGAFIDQRGMKDVLLRRGARRLHRPGARRRRAPAAATWSESVGSETKETLTFLDDDIARFMEEAGARRGRVPTAAAARRRPVRDGVPRHRSLHGRAEAARRLLLRAGRRVRRPPADEWPGRQPPRARRIHPRGRQRAGRRGPEPAPRRDQDRSRGRGTIDPAAQPQREVSP